MKPLLDVVGPYTEAVFELETFVDIVREGFGYATVQKKLIETIRDLAKSARSEDTSKYEAVYTSKLERAKKLEEFAKKQIEKGFPYVVSIATVRLWSILEAAVDDVVVLMLKMTKCARTNEVVRKLKGPIVEFLDAPREEQSWCTPLNWTFSGLG